jgi:gluconokinase
MPICDLKNRDDGRNGAADRPADRSGAAPRTGAQTGAITVKMQQTVPDLPRCALIVMGVSGCGKSTLGALIAQRLRIPFLEGDTFHPPANVEKMRAGTPLEDDDRWPWLDRLGRALGEATSDKGVAVAACSALRRSYRERLYAATAMPTRFILLDNSHDAIKERMAGRSGHYMPPSLLDSQFATLERPQPDEPAITLRTDATPEDLTAAALDWIGTQRAKAAL